MSSFVWMKVLESGAGFLPFGGGAHACQGRWFASDEMLAAVDVILDRVDLEVADDGALLTRHPAEQILLHVYNRPARSVTVRTTPRSEGS